MLSTRFTGTGGASYSYVEPFAQLVPNWAGSIVSVSPVVESPTDYIRAWKMTLTNLGFAKYGADYNVSVFVGRALMLETDVITAGDHWFYGTELAPGDSLTFSGVGESIYVLGDPTASSPVVNFACFAMLQWL